MKRDFRIVLFLLLIFTSVVITPKVFAHPGNTTNTEIFVHQDEEKTRIEGTIYVPWVLALEVLGKSTLSLEEQATVKYAEYKEEFRQYVEPRLVMTSANKVCPFTLVNIPELPEEDVLVGAGVQIQIKWLCEKNSGEIVLKNSLFLETPGQNNTVMVISPSDLGLLQSSVLSEQAQYMVIGNIADRPVTTDFPQAKNDTPSEFLVSQIKTAPIVLLLLFVFLLGLLHTLEAGHSKTLLAAAILDHRINWKQAISVAAVFTVTHVADIVVMGLLFLFANAFIDVYGKLPYLQIFSLYALLLISGYQVLTNLGALIKKLFFQKQQQLNLEHSHDHEHEHTHEFEGQSFKQQIINGFLTGIAPCIFGWSIFMLILSTRQAWLVIPTVLAFGLGIFGGLLVVVLAVSLFKNVIFSRFQKLADLSPLVASVLLFIFVLLQLLR